MEIISTPFEIYTLERTIEKKVFSRFRIESRVYIELTNIQNRDMALQAEIIYKEPIPRYLADEIELYVMSYLDLSPRRN